MDDMLKYLEINDINSKLKTDLLEDSNLNYDTLHDCMKFTKYIFFHIKYVKFHKHRHKKING